MATLRIPIRLRWWIFLYTFLFAMLAYLQRNSLSIAAERIMPSLHLSQMQVAWLSRHGHWYGAFATGTAFAVVAAALWLLIDADRQLQTAALVS